MQRPLGIEPVGRILIVDEEECSREETTSSIVDQLPSAVVEAAASVSELRSLLQETSFDVVILDYNLSGVEPIELLHEIRMGEHEPAVLFVSAPSHPEIIAEMYNHGCQRCVVKDGAWRPQLGPTIRHALRYRKLRERNRELNSRLVESNLLLAEKNRRLDEFSATVAHDIRGPLASLSMKMDFILTESKFELNAPARAMLTSGLESVERLTRIVQSMYEYAKLGASAAQMTDVELGPLVQEVLADMHFSEDSRIIVGLGELPKVWGNRDLLRRLFTNLISNAVRYNDSPQIALSIGVAEGCPECPGELVELFVEDNGRGIPETDLGTIFGMFQRGSSASSDTEGLGVGLAVVQRIAELHGGRVWVSSRVGSGSRFSFSLPLRPTRK